MKYLKVWTDFEDVLQPLEDDEIGRLFLAMLRYARTGEEPSDFAGNEGFLWAVAKRDIDMAAERAETLRTNGMKGGRPKTKENQTKPTETKQNQCESIGFDIKPDESRKEKKRNEMKGNEKESFLSDDAAAEIQNDHNKILDAALDAGFKSSPAERAGLLNLYAAHGLEKMLNGIGECVKHSAPNLAYLEAVLKGTGKKAAGGGYEQRDYTKTQEEAVERMMNGSW